MMQDIKHILFIPHSSTQPINALILTRKLASVATQLGYEHFISESAKTFDASAVDAVIVVGEPLKSVGKLQGKPVANIHLANAQQDAQALLTTALSHASVNEADLETGQAGEPAASLSSSPSSSPSINPSKSDPTRFVAITACPTGVAHTFMAAEALEQGAAKLGYEIEVETQGSVGAKNILSDEDIEQADIVILAADIEVNTDRFVGKRVYRCSTGFALKQTDKAFAQAITEAKVLTAANQAAELLSLEISNGVWWSAPVLRREPSESGRHHVIEVAVFAVRPPETFRIMLSNPGAEIVTTTSGRNFLITHSHPLRELRHLEREC